VAKEWRSDEIVVQRSHRLPWLDVAELLERRLVCRVEQEGFADIELLSYRQTCLNEREKRERRT